MQLDAITILGVRGCCEKKFITRVIINISHVIITRFFQNWSYERYISKNIINNLWNKTNIITDNILNANFIQKYYKKLFIKLF